MRLSARILPLIVTFFVALVLMTPRPATADEFTPEQRKEIEGLIRDFLVNHPDVLVDAIQAADDKLKRDAKNKASKALAEHHAEVFNDPQSPIAGNPQGDITLVEFFDYRCPYCKQVQPGIEKLLREDHQLRVVYKEFPVLGPESDLAARVALAARSQDKYDAFHNAMMVATGHIDEAVIYKVAASVGLDVDQVKQDVRSPDVDKELKANLDLGKALDLDGTPSFIVGDTIVPGAISAGDLRQLIADARGKK
jgi:protein-disulfide isomerase